jgi:hypothetical protein
MADQLSIPIRVLADGRLASLEQGSDAEIRQRVSILCHTTPGTLDDRPGFGLAEDMFTASIDLAEVERQIRALGRDVMARITEDPSLMDQGLDTLGLEVGTP